MGTKCFGAYHGIFNGYRLVKNKSTVENPAEYKGLIKLRSKLNSFMSIGEFVKEARKDLLLRAQELSNGKAVPPVYPSLAGVVAGGLARPQFEEGTLEDVKLMGRTAFQDNKNLSTKIHAKAYDLICSSDTFQKGSK